MDKLIKILLIIVILFGVGLICFVAVDNSFRTEDRLKEQCKELKGTYFLTGLGGTCYGYDSEGYKYYWVQDYDESWYKVRARS